MIDDETTDEVPNEQSDLRDTLDEAFEAAETAEETPAEEPTEEPAETPEETPEEEPAEEPDPTEEASTESEDQPVAAKSQYKAPIGWSPKSREHWSKLPEDIQRSISDREAEVARTIHGTLDARKTHEFLSNLSSSYAPVLAAEGANSPAEAIESLFKTVSELRLGSPQQKAVKVAEIIGQYGVDVGQLDSVLSGQVQTSPQNELETMMDAKLAPMNEVLEQLGRLQQGQQVSKQNSANDAVVEFGKDAEFLNDVRTDMADLLDLAAGQGRDMGLQEAYDKACSMRPEIASVLDNRKATQELVSAKRKVAGKRNAASQIGGDSPGANGSGGDMNLRDQISSIWNDYEDT